MLSRRSLLVGAGAGAVSLAAVAAGLGLRPDGTDVADGVRVRIGEPLPRVTPGPVERGTFTSAARLGEQVDWALLRPPGVDGPLPLVVALHGHGGTTAALLGPEWGLPQFLAQVVADGAAPVAIATASAGKTFYHPRPSGEDAGAMVTDELLPMLLARDDVALRPIGLLGWSMGGYGVLRLAGLLGPGKVAAVVASSPGLYTDPEAAHPNGFRDAAEYERYSVMDLQSQLADIPVRIDIGTEDPFYEVTRTYVAGFPDDADLTVDLTDDFGHEVVYSRRMMPAELRFLADHLR